ncbi:hypothetical protein O0L34_g15285 [Tuta absoluta]|nr:hypothetical protein O0L34_g15285 [Tuta absoluta]
MSENYAAVVHGPNDVRVEKWPMPEINEKEVLIKMDCVGICGSDVKMYTTGRCGLDVLKEPFVMGHEGAGLIAKVGAKVTTLKVGDRVAIEPTQPCRSCDMCKQGKYNLCVEPYYCSSMGAPGNLCRYYRHVADFCHKIPENLSMEEGAAVQPLAIAIHACNRAGIKLGSKIAILGAGPIGVLCAMTARAMGAARVVMTDMSESRLDKAKKLAGVDTLSARNLSDEEMVERIQEILGTRPDVTFDACGYASAQRIAMLVTRNAGVVLVVGIADAMSEVPLSQAMLREVDIRGSYRIMNTYPAALEAVASGAINLKPFITDHFKMAQTKEALALAQSGHAMKVIIHVDH